MLKLGWKLSLVEVLNKSLRKLVLVLTKDAVPKFIPLNERNLLHYLTVWIEESLASLALLRSIIKSSNILEWFVRRVNDS